MAKSVREDKAIDLCRGDIGVMTTNNASQSSPVVALSYGLIARQNDG